MKKQRSETRMNAIDAAELCIKEHGLQGINARNIAKSINCSVGTLYNHFKSIDFLILEVNIRTLTVLEASLQKASNNTLAGNDALKAIASIYIDFTMQNTNAWQALFEHRMPEGLDTPDSYYQQRKQLFQHIEKQLATSHSTMTSKQLALESRALWAGIQGICTLALSNKLDDDNLPLESIVSTLVQHFLNNSGE